MDIAPRTEQFVTGDRSWLGTHHSLNDGFPVTLDGDAWIARFADGIVRSGCVLARAASGLIVPFAGRAAGVDEQQSVAVADATGGTFALTLDGETTGPIAAAATLAQVVAAVEALSNVDAGSVTATGGPLGTAPVVLTFGGRWAGRDVPTLVADDTALTEGATPATVTIATPRAAVAPGAAAGAGKAVAFLLSDKKVRAGTPIGAPAIVPTQVIVARLPANSGFADQVRADLPHVLFR